MKKKMITKLTLEQEAKLAEYRDRWLKIGLDTHTDRPKSELAIDAAYKAAGLEPPRIKIWLKSPREGAMGAALLAGSKTAGEGVGDQVGAQVRDQVWAQVRDQVWAQVRDQVGAQVWAQVGDQVRAQVRDQVGDQVGAQVWAQVRRQLDWGRLGFGSHDANWLGFYQYFLEVCDLACAEKLMPLMELAKHCGWWWPFQNAVVLTDKPIEIHMSEGRLHRDGGPAIRYADDFCVFALNGVRVPDWLANVRAEKIEPKEILKLANAEQRKEGIRKIGIERMRDPLKVEIIHAWKDYELWTIEFEGRRIGPYLKMLNDSTGQIHVEGVGEITREGVDSKIRTCQEALAWRGNLQVFSEPQWTA